MYELTSLKKWVALVLDELEKLWHNEKNSPELGHDEPLDGLILTILSQNTNDKNRDAAFKRLKERFPTWDLVAENSVKNLEEAVRPAGLAPTKSRRILQILDAVHQDFGAYSIKKLAESKNYNQDEIKHYLTALPGVGAKTAACVLLFDMKLPAFPVDTHVSRIARRIGFVPENMSADNISVLLEHEVDPERYLGGHVNMIEHGRGICHSRKPKCSECPLKSSGLCKMYL